MKSDENSVKLAGRRSALDVWVGIISARIDLNRTGNKELYLPATRGRYLLTDRGYPEETAHNDFEVGEGRGLEFVLPFSSF